jgi:hypothetical protein
LNVGDPCLWAGKKILFVVPRISMGCESESGFNYKLVCEPVLAGFCVLTRLSARILMTYQFVIDSFYNWLIGIEFLKSNNLLGRPNYHLDKYQS